MATSQTNRTNAIAGPSNPVKDESSMTSILLAPLDQLQSISHTFFLSLSPIQSKPPPPPPLSSFLACDEVLSSAINLARKHQVKQRQIDALEKDILELEAQWREIVSGLENGRKELEEVIEEGEERIKAIEQAKKGIYSFIFSLPVSSNFVIASIPYPELLAYAQSISAFTSAPPNMPDLSLPGQPPPPLFFPPFPNEEKMRRGHLNAEAPLGLLGETHSVGRRKNVVTVIILLSYIRIAPTVSPKPVDVNQHLHGVNPYRQDLRPPQLQFFDLDLDLNPDL